MMMKMKLSSMLLATLAAASCVNVVESFAPTNPMAVSAPRSDTALMMASSQSQSPWSKAAAPVALSLMLTLGGGAYSASPVLPSLVPPAHAAESARVVGEIKGSGLVFKDTLQIESFPDPKVQGVTLYISNFQKPITERLGSGMFTDPSSASVACAKTGPVKVADTINKSKGGEEVFQESKSLLFKSLRVQRLYDEATQTVVYVTFNTRLDKSDDANKSRFTSGLCAVNLDDSGPAAVAAAASAAATTVAAAAP